MEIKFFGKVRAGIPQRSCSNEYCEENKIITQEIITIFLTARVKLSKFRMKLEANKIRSFSLNSQSMKFNDKQHNLINKQRSLTNSMPFDL